MEFYNDNKVWIDPVLKFTIEKVVNLVFIQISKSIHKLKKKKSENQNVR